MYKVDEVLGTCEWNDWTWQQSNAIKDLSELREKIPWLELGVEQTSKVFQFQVTPYYLSLLDLKNPQDPLAKICLPSLAELHWREGELADPIGDRVVDQQMNHKPAPCIVHRYPDRCLLFLTPLCSSYCRYCFRREMVAKPENTFSANEFEESLMYIEKTSSLREVIFSGGDPLLYSDEKLKKVLVRLSRVPHLRALRLHTRFPIFNPFRVTDDLVALFKSLNKPVIFMVHTMHPREITPELKQAFQKLRGAGVTLLNQSVLVKGCNDDVETLKELSYALCEQGVVNQYLHVMDLARGTSHFRVPLEKAQKLIRELRGRLSGHLIPQLMLDIPGGFGKIPVENSLITEVGKENGQIVYSLQSPHLHHKTLTYRDIC